MSSSNFKCWGLLDSSYWRDIESGIPEDTAFDAYLKRYQALFCKQVEAAAEQMGSKLDLGDPGYKLAPLANAVLTQAEVDELLVTWQKANPPTPTEFELDTGTDHDDYAFWHDDELTADILLECKCTSLDLFRKGCTCGFVKPKDWGLK